MKALKITNPLWVNKIAPLVMKFLDRIEKHANVQGINYESLITHLTQISQFGGELVELWVVFKDEEPVAFATWRVMPLPHFGKVYCDYIFKSVKDHLPTRLLAEEFIKFGQKHKAPLYCMDATDEAIARTLTKLANELGLTMEKTSTVSLFARK